MSEATAARESSGPTYYDRPAIKEPTWIWTVPAYFYAGGAAGAAAVLGAAAQLADRDGLRRLVDRCRWITFGGCVAGTALLIEDLGRKERFLKMLRVFRPTSPMSVGSWVLAAESGLAGVAWLSTIREDDPAPLGDAAGLAAGALGMPLAGYTAVLVSNTAVPVWQAVGRTLPFLFVASAVTSAGSLLQLAKLDPREEAVVGRFAMAGKAAELVASFAVERDAGRVERVGRPLSDGVSGTLWRAAKLSTAASLGLSLLPASRQRRVVGAGLATAGALALRFAILQAGRASARDPRATFDQQHARLDGADA